MALFSKRVRRWWLAVLSCCAFFILLGRISSRQAGLGAEKHMGTSKEPGEKAMSTARETQDLPTDQDEEEGGERYVEVNVAHAGKETEKYIANSRGLIVHHNKTESEKFFSRLEFPRTGEFNRHRKREQQRVVMNAYRTVMTSSQKELLLDLAKTLDQTCTKLNVTCFMYGGTLLGSYRHHDIIPWDDDIDMLVNIRDRRKLYSHLIELAPKYYTASAGPRLKFFAHASERMHKYQWRWPYVDVQFYMENQTFIWDSAKEFKDYAYPKKFVFPLHRRPLGHIHLNAPRDSYANLKATYANPKCETHFYSHKYETITTNKKVSISCDNFKNKLPFVHRTAAKGGVKEILMLGNKVLRSIIIPEPEYAITEPFTLQLVSSHS